MKTHVLILITCLHPNGAEYACLRHIRELLDNRAITVHLIALTGGQLEDQLIEYNVKYMILSRLTLHSIFNLFKFIVNAYSAKYLIHSWMYHANLFALLLFGFSSSPIILSIRQSLPVIRGLKISTLFVAFISGLIARIKNPLIIYNSICGFVDHTEKLLYPSSNIAIVPNTPFMIRSESDFDSFRNDSVIHLLSLARFDQAKDFKYMFSLLAYYLKHYNSLIHLDIYGQNILHYLYPLIHKHYPSIKDYVSLHSHINDITIPILSSDIYLSTSLWEGFPNSLVSAASAGCIPVCTCSGDSWSIFKNTAYKLTRDIAKDAIVLNNAFAFARNTTRSYRSSLFTNDINSFCNSFATLDSIYKLHFVP